MNTPVRAAAEKELMYYRRMCNELGKDLQRVQDESERLVREVRRYQLQTRLDRELSHVTGTASDIASMAPLVLDAVIEHSLCARAMILCERGDLAGCFDILAAAGCRDMYVKSSVTLEEAPAFGHSFEGEHFPSNAAAFFKAVTKLIGSTQTIWNYDGDSGFAILLAGALGPADAMFRQQGDDLSHTALARLVDGYWRVRAQELLSEMTEIREEPSRVAAMAPLTHDAGPELDNARPTIREYEIATSIAKGAVIEQVAVLIREDGEYELFVRPSWATGFRQMLTFRGHAEKVYKDFNRLLVYIRTACRYEGSIVLYAARSPQFEALKPATRVSSLNERTSQTSALENADGSDMPGLLGERSGNADENRT